MVDAGGDGVVVLCKTVMYLLLRKVVVSFLKKRQLDQGQAHFWLMSYDFGLHIGM